MLHPEHTDSTPVRGQFERNSDDLIIRTAVEHVRVNLAALPASEILQLVVFPDTIKDWAERLGEQFCMVSNMCRRHRQYNRLRQVLADDLQVPLAIFSHLIDATPAKPVARQLPDHATILATAGITFEAPRPLIDFRYPPYPSYRDGTNPLEVLALRRLEREAPAMHATRIVSYALFPDGLWRWSKKAAWNSDSVLSVLSNHVRNPKIELALSRRLRVSMKVLDRFIQAERQEVQVVLPAGGVLASEAVPV